MNARNLPGPGDAETFSPAAVANLALLDEMDEQPSDNDIAEAVQEAKDWMDTYFTAMTARNMPRARQAEPEPVRQQQARRDEHPPVDAEWTPSPDELAEIEASERAEAGGQSEQRQAAPAGRRSRGQMNLD